MNHHPLVTVYITNHNYGMYLKQSVESVLAQTCQNFELFIIDDGSTDGSREIIESYQGHPNISIIFQKNKGLLFSNNIAMRSAQGKYLMRLDADDFLAPEALEKMSSLLEQDERLGLVFPDYYYTDAKGNVIAREQRHNFRTDVSLYDIPAHGACTMIRISALRAIGGYNELFTCQDGYQLWIQFVNRYHINNINEPLFYYRRHEMNLTNKEEKILSTRQQINSWFVQTHSTPCPSTVAILPLRMSHIDGIAWPLYRVHTGKTILEQITEEVVSSEKIFRFVICSDDPELLTEAKRLSTHSAKIQVMDRPPEYGRLNEPLEKTVFHVLETLQKDAAPPDAIMLLSIEYPFVNKKVLEDAIHAVAIFGSDSLISVRPDSKMYYTHQGHGLIPFLNQENSTRLERDAVYRREGGIIVCTRENLFSQKKLISGKVGHIHVDQKTAFGVHTPFDLHLFEYLSKQA